jgi:hypothetical protein
LEALMFSALYMRGIVFHMAALYYFDVQLFSFSIKL